MRPFDDSIKNSLELKRFPVSDKEILSLKELEAILPSSKVNHKLKTDASIILNTELNRISTLRRLIVLSLLRPQFL